MLSNASTRFGAYFIALLVNLLATPYIIRQLGVESYGIVGVVNTMISYLGIATSSLTATVGRNATFAVERGEFEEASKEISTATFGLLRIFAIALLPVCSVSLFVERLIVIPQEVVPAVRVFFVLAVLSFIVTTLSGPLGAGMFVRNRLDLDSGCSLLRTLFFVALILVLFNVIGRNLIVYGLAVFASSAFLAVLYLVIHRRLLPGVRISRHSYDRSILRGILSLGGWVSVTQIGALLFLQTNLIVANRVLGTKEAGQLAAIGIIPLHLRVLGGLVSSLFGPTQTALAAKSDWQALAKYLLRSVRLVTLFFALLIGVFCGSAADVLRLWLGREFAPLAPVAVVLTAYLVLSLGSSPTQTAALALGRVKVPALVMVIMGIGNVSLSVYVAHGMGLMGIAIVLCVTLFLYNAVFVPWYISRACQMSLRSYWAVQCTGVLAFLAISLVSYGTHLYLRPDSLAGLVVSLSVSTTVGALLLLPLGLRTIRRDL
ncbi:MAG: hypothetical protein ABSD29_15945 [Verrucomicrobiota bacterium]|jgi:membrane protein EpsK